MKKAVALLFVTLMTMAVTTVVAQEVTVPPEPAAFVLQILEDPDGLIYLPVFLPDAVASSEADPDASCTGTVTSGPGSSGGCNDAWGDNVGYQKIKTLILYYGPNSYEWEYQTEGSDKNYVNHWHSPDDIHTAATWILNFSSGNHIPGCAQRQDHPQGGGGPPGAHGQELQGGLSKEDSTTWLDGACITGYARGIFGAGAVFK